MSPLGSPFTHGVDQLRNRTESPFVYGWWPCGRGLCKAQEGEVTLRLNRNVQPKGDKLPQPLCPSSAHAGHVHNSWPTAVRCRNRALADFPDVADAKLRHNYELAGTHSITMCKFSGLLPVYSRRDPVDTQQPKVACVMRYHPLLPRALKVALRQAPLPPSVNFHIQPSRRNSLPSTLTYLSRHDDSLGSGLLVEGESLLSGRIKSTMHQISECCFP